MAENKKTFGQTIQSLNKTFWTASIMELFERWAWYGMFAIFAIYLVGSTDEGALGLNHIEKGKIMGDITAILYLLPVFFGVIADRIGYKLSLTIAFSIMIIGYFLMGEANSFWMMYMAFFLNRYRSSIFQTGSFRDCCQKHRRNHRNDGIRRFLYDGKCGRISWPHDVFNPQNHVWLEDYFHSSRRGHSIESHHSLGFL